MSNLRYKILLGIIIGESVILKIVNICEIKISQFPWNMIGIFLFSLPIGIGLFWISKEEKIDAKIKIFAKFFLIFIIIAYVVVLGVEIDWYFH